MGTEGNGLVPQEQVRARGTAVLLSLDREQRDAVLARESAIVTAGGGTGKTRVLVHRIAYVILAELVLPRRILVMADSEYAVMVLRAHAERLCGAPIHGAWFGSFVSVAERIVASAMSSTKPYGHVLEPLERRSLVRRVIRALGVDPGIYSVPRVESAIVRKKALGHQLDDEWARIAAAYERGLAKIGAIDADDVERYAIRLLTDDEALRARYQRRFSHIIVDQIENALPAELDLIEALSSEDTHLLAVGDENARARLPYADLLESFSARLSLRRLTLSRNYRSTGRISYVAHRMLRNDPRARQIELPETTRKGARVVAVELGGEDEEALLVTRWIGRLCRQGEHAQRIAILYHRDVQARPFEETLVREGISYHMARGPRFYERKEVRDVVCYLRLSIGGGDPRALAQIANVPRRGIGPASVATIARLQKKYRISMAEAALRVAQLPRVTAHRAGALADLGRFLTDLDEAARAMTLFELVLFIVERSGYGRRLEEFQSQEEESRRSGIDELLSVVKGFPGPAADSLPRFLARWRTPGKRRSGSRNMGQVGVELACFDEAKGKEFDIVFLTGLEEGVFPCSQHMLDGDEGILSERRLCYMAMLRARKRLILTHVLSRKLVGQVLSGPPSRFLREAGRRVRRFRLGTARASPPAIGRPSQPRPDAWLKVVHVGQEVVHPVFGKGVVRHFDEAGPIVVDFIDVGEKRLILKFARLRPA